MSAVRPELGPTLPEVLAPLPRALRLALAALAGLLVLAFVVTRFTGGDDRTQVLVREPVTFNFVHDAGLRRAAPAGAEVVRMTGRGVRFTVAPVTLPPFRGDISGTTPVFMEGLVGEMEQRYTGFVRRMEGRTNINKQQGYELVFQFRERGRTRYGRRVLLFPTPTSREGVDIVLVSDRTAAVPRADAVGRNGPLKVALRSFRFGTERP
jgi:hypothetical protein